MLNNKDNYKESINHTSSNRPFSIHHTIVNKENDLVLYLHWHDEIEFFYMDKGCAILIIDDQQYNVHEGEAILIPPNLLHMAKRLNDKECSFYALVFDQILIKEAYTNATYNRFIQPLFINGYQCILKLTNETSWQKEALQLLNDIFKHMNDDISSWELKFHGTLYIIWYLIYKNYISNINISDIYKRLSLKLSTSIEWIHLNYMNDITLSELAAKSHISKSVFCRYFKQLTGFTPFHYLTRYRIAKCCELLSCTDMKITDVANICGFNNISYFNREFLKHAHMSPTSYKKMIKC